MNIQLPKDNVVGKRKVKKRTIIRTIKLPPPIDTKMYTKQEIINILSPYKDFPHQSLTNG